MAKECEQIVKNYRNLQVRVASLAKKAIDSGPWNDADKK
jgi:hypothetical protein